MKLIVVAVLIAAVMIVGFFVWWMQRRKKKQMEHVVYIHINNHKILPNLGMRFDSHYEVQTSMQPLRDYEFHHTYFSLNIARVDGIEEGFYGIL